jgi:hypothetical protein
MLGTTTLAYFAAASVMKKKGYNFDTWQINVIRLFSLSPMKSPDKVEPVPCKLSHPM